MNKDEWIINGVGGWLISNVATNQALRFAMMNQTVDSHHYLNQR
jgi:hypothetical protein